MCSRFKDISGAIFSLWKCWCFFRQCVYMFVKLGVFEARKLIPNERVLVFYVHWLPCRNAWFLSCHSFRPECVCSNQFRRSILGIDFISDVLVGSDECGRSNYCRACEIALHNTDWWYLSALQNILYVQRTCVTCLLDEIFHALNIAWLTAACCNVYSCCCCCCF